jgi:MFS family permease
MQEKPSLWPFLLLQFSSLTSIISGSMVYLAFPWLALELTSSAISSGFLVALTAIPGLFIAPLVGAVIDRVGRRKVAIAGEFISAFVILLIPILQNTIGISFWLLVAVGIIRAMFSPAGQTARKSLVPDVARVGNLTLERANSIHEAVFAAGFAIGPAIAGVLIVLVGPTDVFWFTGIFLLVAATFAFALRVKEDRGKHEAEMRTANIFLDMKLGIKAILALPPLVVLITSILTLALVYMPTEMVVLPAHFNALNDSTSLALIISVMAGASVFGALAFELIDKLMGRANMFRFAMLAVSVSMIPMALLPDLWLFLICGAILGFSWGPMMPLLNTVIQEKVDPAMRGRVFGIEMSIWNAAPLISMVLVGWAVDSFGVAAVYMSLAISVLLLSIVISLLPQTSKLSS